MRICPIRLSLIVDGNSVPKVLHADCVVLLPYYAGDFNIQDAQAPKEAVLSAVSCHSLCSKM